MKNFLATLKSFLTRKKMLVVVTPLIVLSALAWQTERLPGQKKPEIETTKVKRGKITKTISASGEIEAKTQVTLKFQASGMLAWVGVKRGDRVKKWQAIASLDKKELEKTFQKYANDYLSERWDFEQTQDDYRQTKERKLVTDAIQRILDKAQYDLNKAVLDYEIKDLAVKYATIYSPIDGIVTKIDSPIAGVNITPATAEFTIADSSLVIFKANIDEVDIGLIATGQNAEIVLDAYSNEPIETSVGQIDFQSTATSGGGTAFGVEFALPENISQKFRLGMNGDVDIIVSQKEDCLFIPTASVFQRKDKAYVWLVKDGRTIKQEVATGIETDEEIEILSGLAEGDIVVAKDTSKVKEGNASQTN